MTPLIIIGTGGHAGVVIEAVRRAGIYKIAGLLDDFLDPGVRRHGCTVLGAIDRHPKVYCDYFIAVGENQARDDISKRVPGVRYANVIHPSANVPQSGWPNTFSGVFVGANAWVGPECHVGEFAIVNTNASLDHDGWLGAYSHLCPGVVTGGHATIGNHTMVGIGACIRDHVKIGNNCLIGMGSVVVDNVPDDAIGWGNPFRCK